MQVWNVAIIVSVCGAVGGFVSALLAGNLHLPHRETTNLYNPGWVGNVVVGAVASLVFWGLYGPMAKASLIGGSGSRAEISLTIAEVAGSIVTGIGGARILSNEIEKKAMAQTKKNLTEFTESGENNRGD